MKTPSFPHIEEYLTWDPAIMESGNAVGPPYNGTEWHQPMYNRLVQRTGSVSHRKAMTITETDSAPVVLIQQTPSNASETYPTKISTTTPTKA